MGIYVYFEDGSHGPLDEETVNELLAQGKITFETMGWQEGLADWVPLRDLVDAGEPYPMIPETAASAGAVREPGHNLSNIAGKVGRLFARTGRQALEKAKVAGLRVTLDERFSRAFAKAAADGVLTDAEMTQLRQMTEAAGVPWQKAVATCRPAARQIVLHAVEQALDDGVFTPEEEQAVRQLANTCGLTWEEVITIAEPLARKFVRHVLADAASDGKITADERQVIMGHIERFDLDDMRSEVTDAITRINLLYQLSHNVLPPALQIQRDWLSAGEAVYLYYGALREKVSGKKQSVSTHSGHFIVTDYRLEFLSETYGGSWRLTSLRELEAQGSSTLTMMTSKGREVFKVPDAGIVAALTKCLMRLGNRLVSGGEMDSRDDRRMIAKEVRNAVWIRDGGRCVECGASDYLEFDHIIPVSRGGAATVANVQLLCRRCNSTKGAAL